MIITKERALKELSVLPGVGKSIATDLWNNGIKVLKVVRPAIGKTDQLSLL